jgi:AMMECR1 domain-containing protein
LGLFATQLLDWIEHLWGIAGTWLRARDKWGQLRYMLAVCTLAAIGPSLPLLARDAIEYWLRHHESMNVDDRAAPAAPVFVTLHLPRGELRGCMGTLVARERDVRRETLHCAVLAATRDPRFTPVPLQELQRIAIDVTVLCPLESICGPEFLDPKRYGVVVCDVEGRRGVLLPDLDGIDDVNTQLTIARRKAGIAAMAPVELKRFEALRFYEH